MFKPLAKTILACVSLSLPLAVAADTPDASSYVQSGLVGHYDGIDNAGTGTHDPGATAWKDLAGTLGDGALGAGAVWADGTCWTNAANGQPVTLGAAFSTNVATKTFTVELVLKPDAVNVRRTLLGNYSSAQNFNIECYSDARIRCYYNGNPDWYPGAKLAAGATSTVTLVTTPSSQTLYTNGVSAATRTGTIGAALAAGPNTIVGGELARADMAFRGAYYAVRVYNRALGGDEIAFNAMIDGIRFFGNSPPDDYQYEGGRHYFRVSVSGEDGATVSTNGVDFASSFEFWVERGESRTVTVQVPAGMALRGWTGAPAGAVADGNTVSFTVTAPVALTAHTRTLVTKYWRGGTSASAAEASNWSDTASLDAEPSAEAPLSGDTIVFDGMAAEGDESPNSQRACDWNIDDAWIANWLQNGYTNAVTFYTGPVYSNVVTGVKGLLSADGLRRELVVTGNVSIASGSWKPADTPSLSSAHPGWKNGEGVYRLIARAGGDFTLAAGAAVVAKSGFAGSAGPGTGSSNNGGSHGGNGGQYSPDSWAYPDKSYGLVRAPVTIGSGGNHGGGAGAIQISVGETLTINGSFDACALPGNWGLGGAGGSVYLTAKAVIGAGEVKASSTSTASGGRVALIVTGAGNDLRGYTGTISAISGTGNSTGRAGTIYLETPADKARGGVLRLMGYGNASGTYGFYTPLSNTSEDFGFARIELTNCVFLGIGPGVSVRADEFVSLGANNNYLCFLGGDFEVPNGYVFTNMTLRADKPGSTLSTALGAADEIVIEKGVPFTINKDFAVTAKVRLRPGVTLNHFSGDSADTYGYRANLAAAGLTIEEGASVNLDGRGYTATFGPGQPADAGKLTRGGTHGGTARDVGSVKAYGSVSRPAMHGSGGNTSAGGGAAHFVIAGKTIIDGTVTANGASGNYSGAGGSLWLETGTLEGAATGVIRANGGANNNNQYAAGGGGRVAITLTGAGADFGEYLGIIEAKGGTATVSGAGSSAGTGTVYLRKGGEAENDGTLILDAPVSAEPDGFTDFTSAMDPAEVGAVVVTNGALLRVRNDAALSVRRSFANASVWQGATVLGEAATGNAAAGTVVLTDSNVACRVTGTNVFMCLRCAAPGKTVRFGGVDDTLTVVDAAGAFEMAGEAGAPVYLRGNASGVPWGLNLMTGAAVGVAYVDVMDSNADYGMKVVADQTSVDSGNNDNWDFMTVMPGETIVWTGAANSNWTDPANWNRGRVPRDTDVVEIPVVATMPELGKAVVLNRLKVAVGARLSLAGFSLTVTNGVDCLGALVCSGAETLNISGAVTVKGFTCALSTVVLSDCAGSVDFNGQSLHALVCGGGSVRALAFAGGFSTDRFTCSNLDSAFAVAFAAGKTLSVGEFVLDGEIDGVCGLTLASSAPGTAWRLNLTGKTTCSGVTVSDSDASGGRLAQTLAPSVDADGNSNWLFNVTGNTWTGAKDKKWSTAGNWSAGSVPDANTRVVVSSAATIDLNVAATVLDLEIPGAVTFTGTNTLRIVEWLDIVRGGTLCQQTTIAPIQVDGNAYVRSGGTWTHTKNGNSDLGYGVYATVAGDLVVESGGLVTAKGKGYNGACGPGKSVATDHGGSHGARFLSGAAPSYGSVFTPTLLGSGGYYYSTAGGRVRLEVGGAAAIAGEIDVDGEYGAYSHCTGGSILLACGALTGSGWVHAHGAYVSVGCGGRVAVKQSRATDFAAFTGRISACGGTQLATIGGIPAAPAGTVYLQSAGAAANAGTVYVRNSNSTLHTGASGTGGVDLPVTNLCADAAADYRRAAFDVSEGGVLYLTQDITIGDLALGAASRVNLNGHVLTLRSAEHRKGVGWAPTAMIVPGTDADGNPGRIVWDKHGLVIILY